MPRDVAEVLGDVRDELYQARVLTSQLRNKTKTLAAAYADSEQRIEQLIDEVENALDGSPDQEVQGRNGTKAYSPQAH